MAEIDCITSKKCSKCGIEKPLSGFSKRKSSSDGLRSACRPCASEEYKSWASINKKPKPAPVTRWRAENGDLVAKLCGKCNIQLPPSEFHKNADHKDGLATQCKECARKRANDWYADNIEYGRTYRREWHHKNRDASLPRMKEYRANNLQRILAKGKEYRNSHKEEKRAMDKAWQTANPEKVLVYKRVSQARRRKQVRGSAEHYSSADVEFLRKKQRSKCACCKKSLSKGYHIDHVVALSKGGSNSRLNIQLLCPTCNLRKNAKDPIQFMQENGYLL